MNFAFRPRTILPIMAVLVAGCGKEPAQKFPVGHVLPSPLVSKCEPGQPGGRVELALAGAPRTFNPVLATDGPSDAVIRMLFAPLVSIDLVTQEITPALAESWSVALDHKTWTFKLRKDLRWSDGQPLTAADVAFTWNEVMSNPNMNSATYDLFRINGQGFSVTNVDAQTVRVVTPEVFAPFLEYFGTVPILPEHTMGNAVRTRSFLSVYTPTTAPQRIVGAGPFRMKECLPGKFIRLERNPEYWMVDREKRRLPYFDEVLLLLTPGGNAPAFLFFDGKSAVFESPRPDEYTQFKAGADAGKYRLVELGPGMEREFLWFNLNTGVSPAGQPIVNPKKLGWFRNRKFRQAVSCALDRDRMVREIYAGRAQPIHAFLSGENQKWNNPAVPQFAHDPARARALLAEMDLQDRDNDGVLEDADGAKIEFRFNSNSGNPSRERCAGFIAEDLRQLGFKIDFQLVSFTNLVDRVNVSLNYDCILMGLGGGAADPASQANVLKSSEPLHQWFPNQTKPATDWEARIDSLMDGQMRTLEFAERKKLFDEVQAILAEEMPMIYTVAPFHFAAVRNDLANLRPSVLTSYRVTWNVEELYFKKP